MKLNFQTYLILKRKIIKKKEKEWKRKIRVKLDGLVESMTEI
jgi:hypothetical protein